jgi:arylformamidase
LSGELIDISVALSAQMPTWPGAPGFEISRHSEIARGDDANASLLRMDVHSGTHIDAPLHFVDDGATTEQIPFETLVGAAYVADIAGERRIGEAALEAAAIPAGTQRLLLRTRDTSGWDNPTFDEDAPALSQEGAEWVVARGIRLIGIDYLSIQRFEDDPTTHRILLDAGVVILEGLDLAKVAPGMYDLTCLPVRLAGAEAAPARAVLRTVAT